MARINGAAWAPSLAGGRRAWRCPTCSRDSRSSSVGQCARSGKLPQSRRSGRACAGTQSIPACEEPESGADAARGSQHTAPSCRDTAAPPALSHCASLERLLSWDLANFLGHAASWRRAEWLGLAGGGTWTPAFAKGARVCVQSLHSQWKGLLKISHATLHRMGATRAPAPPRPARRRRPRQTADGHPPDPAPFPMAS